MPLMYIAGESSKGYFGGEAAKERGGKKSSC